MNLLPDCDIVLLKQCIFLKILSELNNMSNKNSIQKNWTSWHHLLHKEFLGNETLIPDGANLLMAVSGGQDSMALLNLINDMKTQPVSYYTSPSPRDRTRSRMPSSA